MKNISENQVVGYWKSIFIDIELQICDVLDVLSCSEKINKLLDRFGLL